MMGGKLRALVVDDDITVAGIHRQFVDAHPAFTVIGEANTGAAALDQIERLNPDLVLLDIYLPDLSGLEILSRMRIERGRTVEVIVVTAARDLVSVREARRNGVRHYLVKPFTAEALRSRLDEVVRQYRRLSMTGAGQALDQRTVDEIIARSPAPEAPPPKGVSPATLENISTVLREAGTDLSASEVGEIVGMSRVGARRYLEHLVSEGLATVEPRYGVTGRPENRYRSAR